jgi:hypothetical protein
MKLSNEYTIEPDFSTLAGPYNAIIPQELAWMEKVVEDMKQGNIEYRVTASGSDFYVERKGMIVTKRKP